MLLKCLVAIPLTVVLTVTSCTDGFEELNVDPFSPTETSNQFLFNGIVSQLQKPGNFVLYTANQRLYQWSQLAASAGGGPAAGSDSPNNMNTLGIETTWYDFFAVGRTYRALEKRLEEDFDPERQTNTLAIARILWAYYALQVTDLYGGMPFSEAGMGALGIPRPKYDTQEEVYTSALAMLKEAVDNIIVDYTDKKTAAGNAYADYGSGDIFLANDMAEWKKFGNTVRLRHGLRISNVNASLAQTHVSEAISGGVLDGDGFAFTNNGANWFGFEFYAGIRMGENAWKYMNADDDPAVDGSDIIDPRVHIWYETNEDDEWVAMPQSWGANDRADMTGFPYQSDRRNDNDDVAGDFKGNYSGFNWYMANTSDSESIEPTFTASEVCFMKAEAILKGWASGSAQTEYENGIRSSIIRWYAEGALHNDWTAAPPTPTDGEINDFITHARIAYAGDGDAGLRQIHTQRWLDYYKRPEQAWHLILRGGTIPMLEVKHRITDEVLPTPRRIQYPIDELNQNADNYLEQIQRIGGADEITVRNWWDVN
ncbi:MAG: SusD/RagB family nutrient-binding outer membrane lipoprotein [Cyclobacteriaceae bacterium]